MNTLKEYTEYWIKMADTTHPHWWDKWIKSGQTLKTFVKIRYKRYKARYESFGKKKATKEGKKPTRLVLSKESERSSV